MKIFIICCLLFIHVNMCIFICGFRISIRVSGIRGFDFGDGFPPESVSGSGFDFGFRFLVHGDSTRSEPDPLPFLDRKAPEEKGKQQYSCTVENGYVDDPLVLSLSVCVRVCV